MVSASPSISLNSSSLQLLQPSAMLAGECIAPRKLKIKLSKLSSQNEIVSSELDRSNVVFSSYVEKVSLKTVGNSYYDGVSGMSQSHVKRRVLLKSDSGAAATPDKNKLRSSIGDHPLDIQGVSDIYMESCVSHANKRGPVRKLESQQAKKQKIDSKVMVQCLALLKKLINDKNGWGFRNPVDPIAMNIPDYFKIISEPMDLGTIKSKLEKKLYTKTEEFAADVRLTFNNAMLYNPPANYFHVVAKELSNLFESRWKVLESKWSAERLKATQQLNSDERSSSILDMKQDSHRTQASCPKISVNVSTASGPKQKRREDLVEISKIKFSQPLLEQRDEKIDVDADVLDEVTSCKPQKVARNCHHPKSVEAAHTQSSSGQNSLQKDLHEGISFSSRQASVSVSDKSRPSSACVNGSCESMNSRVSRKNSFSSGDICVIDEENSHPSSRPSTPGNDVGLDEGWENSLYDGHLSPSKALRAAILRSRFADTIVKAQQKTLLNNGGKSDPVKLKQEKERLEKQQREEKARIEAQIRAAEAASRMREEMELKMQREREREAARIALQKMERTVEIYENLDILKDLEMLGASLEQDILVHNASPLARLGLFIKDEDLEDEDELETCSQVVELENHSLVVEVKNCNTDLEVENCSTDLNLENNNADVEEGEIA